MILVGAITDLAVAFMGMGWPEFFAKRVIGLDKEGVTGIGDEIIRTTQVAGTAALEAGVGGGLVVVYRIVRRQMEAPFNGFNYQLILALNTLGRSLALGFDPPVGGRAMEAVHYILLLRLIVSAAGLGLSVFVYRKSWDWLCGPAK
jgi:hypothetical protein